MKYILQITNHAKKELASLDPATQKQIAKKIDFYLSLTNPLSHAERLTIPFLGMFRFRIGHYRVMFQIEPSGTITILLILTIKHRKDIYR